MFKYRSADQIFQLDASVVLYGVDHPLADYLSCLGRGSKMDIGKCIVRVDRLAEDTCFVVVHK